jgi:tetratricopeptide (TPR) repeat protein
MKFFKLTAVVFLGTAIGAGDALAETQFEQEQKIYQDCVELSLSKPDLAYTNALTWLETGGGLPAHHCVALSLAELGRYHEAARELEIMADDMVRGFGWPFSDRPHPKNRGMLAAIYSQAGNAWLLAGEIKKAITVFGLGLREVELNTPENAGLLIDRARAQAGLGSYQEALRDLSLAETMVAENADILSLKANAYRALGQFDLAEEELRKAFNLNPVHREAMLERGNLKLDQGDNVGARQDWIQYLSLYPEGTGADAIRKNLEAMDVRVEEFYPEETQEGGGEN